MTVTRNYANHCISNYYFVTSLYLSSLFDNTNQSFQCISTVLYERYRMEGVQRQILYKRFKLCQISLVKEKTINIRCILVRQWQEEQ